MLNRNDIIFRSLVEQVEYNKEQIEHILQVNSLMAGAGVKLVGNVSAEGDLPATDSYPGNYGDAYLVGTERPYDMYVFTRPTTGEDYPHWFNVGPFPAPSDVPGPQGLQGEQGEQGERGSQWSTGTTAPAVGAAKRGDMYLQSNGVVYMFDGLAWNAVTSLVGPTGSRGPIGPQGERGEQGFQGPQGVAGDPGDTVKIVGVLASSDLLPQPTEEDRHHAYLIGGHLWIVIGDASLSWIDTGAIGFEVDPNKFVTIDTAQSISGDKTFSGAVIANEISLRAIKSRNGTQFLNIEDGLEVGVGSSGVPLILNSSVRPVKNTRGSREDIAYLSDAQQAAELWNEIGIPNQTGSSDGIGWETRNGSVILNGAVADGKLAANVLIPINELTLNESYTLMCMGDWSFTDSRSGVTLSYGTGDYDVGYIRNPTGVIKRAALSRRKYLRLYIYAGQTFNNVVLKPILVRGDVNPTLFKPGEPLYGFVVVKPTGLNLSGTINSADLATDYVLNFERTRNTLRYVSGMTILGDTRSPTLIQCSDVPQIRVGSTNETISTREWVEANVKTLYKHRLTYFSSTASMDLIICLISSDHDAYGNLAAIDKKSVMSVQGTIDGDPVVLFYTPGATDPLEVATAHQRFDLSDDLATGDTVSELW